MSKMMRCVSLLSSSFALLACGSATHLVRDIPTRLGEAVQVVVEIPAGSSDKYEVNKTTGELQWQMKNGRPRVIDYLSYPGNYGFVPRTLSPKEQGGDGDPLDVLVLGPARRRAEVMQVRLIGVLKLLDEGEQDDKIIAVPALVDSKETTPLVDIHSLEELRAKRPGIDAIIELWFSNYDGAQTTEVVGWGDEHEARRLLTEAEQAFRKRE